jgi:Zn-dependent alcohol dehydrogenase
VIQGAKIAGALKIIAVDVNPKKFEIAKQLGAIPRRIEIVEL